MVVTDDLQVSWEIEEGLLYLMDYTGQHSFGDPTLLVDPDDLFADTDHLAFYPAWSPDGAWIAFNTSTGDSYDDEDAELWVVDAAGGTPVLLEAANMGEGLTNSWPRWSPLPDDDILWLTFSSRRDYGYVAQRSEPQVWVTAFDPAEIEAGNDPSSPAFWLVGQDPMENNHVPVWIE
jgi:Tol biopolymer transport system component